MKSSRILFVLMFLAFLSCGCSKDKDKFLYPEIHIITSTTITITNWNSWDWENVSVILNPGNVVTSNFPKHGQYVMQYQGFLWETKRIKANQKMTINLNRFVDDKGKQLTPGSLPSAIEIDTFQVNGAMDSYQGDFHQDQ